MCGMHGIAWAVAVYVAQEGEKGASTDKRVALIRCVREDAAKRKARFTPFHNPLPRFGTQFSIDHHSRRECHTSRRRDDNSTKKIDCRKCMS